MRSRKFAVVAAVLLAVPALLHAQQVDAGFSRKQVEARLGPPAAVRTAVMGSLPGVRGTL